MAPTLAERNKQLALKAFDTLFNRHDYEAAATMWSEGYIQHSTEIAPGRDGLFERVRLFPPTFRYENALAVAKGDYVVLHGRFSGLGRPRPMICQASAVLKATGRDVAGGHGSFSSRSWPSTSA